MSALASIEERMRAEAEAAVAATIAAGAELYVRERDLRSLIGWGFDDLMALPEPARSDRIAERLDLRIEVARHRCRSGHWAFDPNDLVALLQAREGERRRMPVVDVELVEEAV